MFLFRGFVLVWGRSRRGHLVFESSWRVLWVNSPTACVRCFASASDSGDPLGVAMATPLRCFVPPRLYRASDRWRSGNSLRLHPPAAWFRCFTAAVYPGGPWGVTPAPPFPLRGQIHLRGWGWGWRVRGDLRRLDLCLWVAVPQEGPRIWRPRGLFRGLGSCTFTACEYE